MIQVLALKFFFLSALNGCSDSPEEAHSSAVEAEFQESMQLLSEAYGQQGKMDFSSIVDPCTLLEPLRRWGAHALRSGFFMGVSGEGVLGPVVGVGGYDLVWDFYHAQLTVSSYRGKGLTLSPGAAASVSAYAGWVSGFHHGVADWDGFHVAVSTEISAPFLREYLHLKPEVFFSGEDENENGQLEVDELLLPPDGLYGFSMGVGVGVEFLPEALPVSASVIEGEWRPHHPAIAQLYRSLKTRRLFPFVGEPLSVHLIDEESGAPCPEEWSGREGEPACVIQFGEPGWSHTATALHVAASVCSLSGGCLTPLSWPQSGLAVAIGAWRDQKEDPLDRLCGD